MNMICKKCKKQIQDDSAYCPYCGKQVKAFKPSFNNMEWLSVCTDDEFAKNFAVLKKMEPGDARNWLFNMHDKPETVWQIEVEFEVSFRGNEWGWHSMRGLETLKNAVSGIKQDDPRYNYRFIKAYPKEKELKKADFLSIGTDVFFSEAECQKRIDEIVDKK